VGLRLRFAGALLACPLFALTAHSQESDQLAEEDFVAWAGEVAIPFDLEAGPAPERLAAILGGRRIVYLGEPDHFIHEKYPFRLGFLRALHGLGWRHLGMEMGRSDGLNFDRYLETGDERSLFDIGLYSSAPSIESGIRAGSFLGMELSYARDLRALASGPQRVRYFGFDVDVSPGNGWDDALARVTDVDGGEELALILADLRRSRERVDGLEAVVDELRDPDAALGKELPVGVQRQLALDLDTLAESLRFGRTPLFDDDVEPVTLVDAFTRRERLMFRTFDAYHDALPEGTPIALTGHNLHLSRRSQSARWFEIDSEQAVALLPSIGAHVTERFPDDVFAVWLVYDHGRHLNATDISRERELKSVPGTVESLLGRLPHDALLLPLASEDPRSRWLDGERSYRVNGGVGYGRLRELTDALVFVREVHPPTPD